MSDVIRYLGIEYDSPDEENNNMIENKISYDYVLIDVDSAEEFEKFKLETAEKNYFVTAFDTYSLRRGIEVFQNARSQIKLTKVLFSFEQTKEEEEYLDRISLEFNIKWDEYTIYFPISIEDIKVIQENQRLDRLRFRRLSVDYKDSIASIVQDMNKEERMGRIKKIMKDLG